MYLKLSSIYLLQDEGEVVCALGHASHALLSSLFLVVAVPLLFTLSCSWTHKRTCCSLSAVNWKRTISDRFVAANRCVCECSARDGDHTEATNTKLNNYSSNTALFRNGELFCLFTDSGALTLYTMSCWEPKGFQCCVDDLLASIVYSMW